MEGSISLGYELEVEVPRVHRYRIQCQPGLLQRYGELLANAVDVSSAVILSDQRVYRIYGAALQRSLASVGICPEVMLVPDGERSKNMATFVELLDRLAEIGARRRSVLINFGGGVITDLGGFVASAYMRGIPYVNFSTSLIGQLDASVGGKVAVDAKVAKNLIGAFHHPRHVAVDPELLGTLSGRDFKSGIAEAIKVAIISRPDLFTLLEREHRRIRARDASILVDVIGLAIQGKMDLLDSDPYENDLRRPLNLGHTIGHPIETEFDYIKVRHGEAVAVGTAVATQLALMRKWIARVDAERIFDLLDRYELLQLTEPLRPDRLIRHFRYVRMIRDDCLHFVLPRGIGQVTVSDDLSDIDLVRGFDAYNAMLDRRRAGDCI